MALKILPAVRKKAKLRLALTGVTGGGKTKSALLIARGLCGDGGRILVVDTENESASLYSGDEGIGTFDTIQLDTFAPGKYVEAIHEAERAGYDVLVIDSLSHAWVGKDGAIERKDNAARRGGNDWTAWRDVTPQHNEMVDAIIRAKCHVIATMRSKMEHVQEKDSKGNTVIKKVGLAPIQRDGLEYEFTVVADMDMGNNMVVTKSRCDALTGKVFHRPGANVARTLLDWLNSGADVPPPPPAPPPADDTARAFLADHVSDLKAAQTEAEVESLATTHGKNYPQGHALRGEFLAAYKAAMARVRTATLPTTSPAN